MAVLRLIFTIVLLDDDNFPISHKCNGHDASLAICNSSLCAQYVEMDIFVAEDFVKIKTANVTLAKHMCNNLMEDTDHLPVEIPNEHYCIFYLP